MNQKKFNLLWTIFVILLFLWLPGVVSRYTMGGVIHIRLVIAIIVLVIKLILFRDEEDSSDLNSCWRRWGIGKGGGRQVGKDFCRILRSFEGDNQNRR